MAVLTATCQRRSPCGRRSSDRRLSQKLLRATYYQLLFDSGQVKNRADLARFFGVSRARVTQVLKRLFRYREPRSA